MTTNLFKHIVIVIIIGLAFLAVNCSDKPDKGTHVHADGTVHADDAPTSDVKTDDQGRSYHIHADGSIHYLEPSESRVSGSTIIMSLEEIAKYDIGVATAGPDQLRRIDRRRTVTLQVRLPEGMSVEEGIDLIKTKVTPAIESALPEDGFIRYSGSADKLKTTLENMSGTFLLAIAILYLLISALFRSFKDLPPLVTRKG